MYLSIKPEWSQEALHKRPPPPLSSGLPSCWSLWCSVHSRDTDLGCSKAAEHVPGGAQAFVSRTACSSSSLGLGTGCHHYSARTWSSWSSEIKLQQRHTWHFSIRILFHSEVLLATLRSTTFLPSHRPKNNAVTNISRQYLLRTCLFVSLFIVIYPTRM